MGALDEHQEIVCGGGGLRVAFQWRGDRYQHSLAAVAGDRRQLLLQSREGDEQQVWPASPPLQQLSLEHRPGGGTVALAVGMAGSSHWSLSVEADPRAAACEFDVACRCAQPAAALGSLYQVTGTCHLEDGRLFVRCPLGEARVTPLPAAQQGPCELQWDQRRALLRIAAEGPSGAAQNAAAKERVWTVRWRYRIEWRP